MSVLNRRIVGVKDNTSLYNRLSPFFIKLNQIQFQIAHTAYFQIQKLSFSAGDVQHIVLTHLDFDHAGGITDFPGATVHVMKAEYKAAHNRIGFIGKKHYCKLQ